MIRTQTEINVIINRGQQALAGIGPDILEAAAVGVEDTDPDQFDLIVRLTCIRAILQTILTPDGNVIAYFASSVNEKKFNNILDGLAALSKQYSGPFIPMLGVRNIPLVYYNTSGSGGGGGGATPNSVVFQNVDVDSPGEIVDSFIANGSSVAFYTYTVEGQNIGEGSRSGFFMITWRGTTVSISGDPGTPNVGGTTAGVSFSAAIVGGQLQLTCNVPSNNWKVTGIRFYT